MITEFLDLYKLPYSLLNLLAFFHIKRISNQARINKEIHPHQLRHSYATHLLNNSAPIAVIQSLKGHEKSESTRIYAQLSGRHRKEFYQWYF
ncbi:tyrosine-type recombinase/integrase [Viridibacillus arvi]|uniref:tyrosine-type recombinase/integrase n=1 Tax=Viridibacillus arvi TaxID=263475 RepID=UPI003D013B8B